MYASVCSECCQVKVYMVLMRGQSLEIPNLAAAKVLVRQMLRGQMTWG